MNSNELRALAKWLLGETATVERVEWFVGKWQERPQAAARWAEVREREVRAAIAEGMRP